MRQATVERKTGETSVKITLALEGKGDGIIDSGIGFFDHMLNLFSKHGRFDLSVKCIGDTEVDGHHSVEDIGITLGQAFREALGDAMGIARYGDITLPMDEALVLCAVDISGRSTLGFDLTVPSQKIGDYDTELTEEFFLAFVRSAGVTLHVRALAGSNSHHITEAAFKAFGRAMSAAVRPDERFAGEIPSTKGTL